MVRLLVIVCFTFLGSFARADDLVSLVYHDIAATRGADEYVLTEDEFESHLRYLRDDGYQPVSLSDIQAAREGKRSLPKRAVLITFDDGLRSYRDSALPLLRRYGYPSVLAVVSQWADGQNIPEAYRHKVMAWKELRELLRDPLIEIASHTHAMHHELTANPHGEFAPATVARAYDSANHQYESDAEFGERIRSDLARSRNRFIEELKKPPRALAWPYGEYDGVGMEVAAALGFSYQFTLDDEPNRLASLPRIHRVMLRGSYGVAALQDAMRANRWQNRPLRALFVRISDFAGGSGAAHQQRFMPVFRQAELLRVNTVILVPDLGLQRSQPGNGTVPTIVADDLIQLLQGLRDVEVRQVYLDLSSQSTLPSSAKLEELLSRIRIQGLILGKNATVITSVRKLQPWLRLGMAGVEAASWPDFFVEKVDISTGQAALRNAARVASHRTSRTLLLATGVSGTDPRGLAEQLRNVRAEGVRDFGIDFALLPHAGADSIQIALELAGHVAVKP